MNLHSIAPPTTRWILERQDEDNNELDYIIVDLTDEDEKDLRARIMAAYDRDLLSLYKPTPMTYSELLENFGDGWLYADDDEIDG